MDLFGLLGAGIGALSNSGSGSKSETTTSQPYGPATGWLNSNITDGQALQDYYKQNPFSQAQQNAYGNSLGLSNGFRNVMGGLNKQMSSTQYFDRSNPQARPQSYNFTGGDTSQAGYQPQSVNNGTNIQANPWANMPTSASSGMPTNRGTYTPQSDGSGYTTAPAPTGDSVNNPIQSLGIGLQNLGLGSIGQAVTDYGFSKTPNAAMSLADQYQSYGMGRAAAEALAAQTLSGSVDIPGGGGGGYGLSNAAYGNDGSYGGAGSDYSGGYGGGF